MSVRLNKLLAERGIGARRKCDALIEQGVVRVNGEVVRVPGTRVEPERDRIEVEGRSLPGRSALVYYVLHKPVGVISTLSDPEGRRTLREFMPKGPRLFPVGRLDADTSGLLLITNDGELAHHLMHPRYGVTKLYRAHADRAPSPAMLERLRNGIEFEPGIVSAPAVVRVREGTPGEAVIEIAMGEGRYHQVRLMCEAAGLAVHRLHRWGYGPLRLAGLDRGMWRELSEEEVRRLRVASARPKPRLGGGPLPGAPRRRRGRPAEPDAPRGYRPVPIPAGEERRSARPSERGPRGALGIRDRKGVAPAGRGERTRGAADRPRGSGGRAPVGRGQRDTPGPAERGRPAASGRGDRVATSRPARGDWAASARPPSGRPVAGGRGDRVAKGRPARGRPAPRGRGDRVAKGRPASGRPAPRGHGDWVAKGRPARGRPVAGGRRPWAAMSRSDRGRPAANGRGDWAATSRSNRGRPAASGRGASAARDPRSRGPRSAGAVPARARGRSGRGQFPRRDGGTRSPRGPGRGQAPNRAGGRRRASGPS